MGCHEFKESHTLNHRTSIIFRLGLQSHIFLSIWRVWTFRAINLLVQNQSQKPRYEFIYDHLRAEKVLLKRLPLAMDSTNHEVLMEVLYLKNLIILKHSKKRVKLLLWKTHFLQPKNSINCIFGLPVLNKYCTKNWFNGQLNKAWYFFGDIKSACHTDVDHTTTRNIAIKRS